jgi:hypothetical protein
LQIYSLLKGSGMTQVEIGKILGVPQPAGVLAVAQAVGEFFAGAVDGVSYGAAAGRADYRAAYAQRAWGAFATVGVGAGNG